jgi:hypothetical protein
MGISMQTCRLEGSWKTRADSIQAGCRKNAVVRFSHLSDMRGEPCLTARKECLASKTGIRAALCD